MSDSSDSSESRLQVELFLPAGRITGLTGEVQERQRLIDVLNSRDDVFRLQDASVLMASTPGGRSYPTLNVEKRAILAAIPRENEQQMRQRSLQAAFGGRRTTLPVRTAVVLPPFVADGIVHVPQGITGAGDKLHANPQIFGRFIPMTAASLLMPDGSSVEGPVILINRDLVGAMSVLEDKRTD